MSWLLGKSIPWGPFLAPSVQVGLVQVVRQVQIHKWIRQKQRHKRVVISEPITPCYAEAGLDLDVRVDPPFCVPAFTALAGMSPLAAICLQWLCAVPGGGSVVSGLWGHRRACSPLPLRPCPPPLLPPPLTCLKLLAGAVCSLCHVSWVCAVRPLLPLLPGSSVSPSKPRPATPHPGWAWALSLCHLASCPSFCPGTYWVTV